MIAARDALNAVFDPASVAVFGASEDTDKFGGRLFAALLRHGYDRPVYPINPRRNTLLGLTAYPDLASVPGPVDVAAIALPTDAAIEAVDACSRLGVKAVIMISTGFGEAGPEGKARQDLLLDRVRTGGPRILGPNCLGAINTAGVALCSTIALERVPMVQGHVSLISHSGALLGSMMSIAQDQGIGFRYLVSGGNEADLDMADYIEFCIDDPQTHVIAAFIEDIRQPARFMAAARRAAAAGKPIVAVKVGRSDAAAAVAASHTGALTGDDRVNDAMLRALGVVRVTTPEDLVVAAHALARFPAARRADAPRGLAVLSASGGACGMLADLAADAGIDLPDLAPAMEAGLDLYYDHAVNPLDLGGMRNPTFQPDLIRGTLDALGAHPEVGTILLGLTTMPMIERNMAEVAAFADAWGRPVLAYSIAGQVAVAATDRLRAAGLPVFASATSAIAVAAVLTARRSVAPPAARPGGHHAAPPASSTDDGHALLARYGIAGPRQQLCRSADEAAVFAASLGGPIAVKIHSDLVPHKTEADAIRLGVVGGPAARSAFKDVNASARAWLMARDDRLELGERPLPVLCQEMVSGVEVLVGGRVDPGFGPLVVVGVGGILVELLATLDIQPAPVTVETARAMIARLPALERLLAGFRGAPPADIDALVNVIVRLGWLISDQATRFTEIELNPVTVLPRGQGARYLDALFVLRS